MASGESSSDLEGYLRTLGVRDRFTRLYGPDLINTMKGGPDFYEQMLADVHVAPADAIIVDDSRAAVGWAAQVGARTVLVTAEQPPQPLQVDGLLGTIGSLAELPGLLDVLL